MVFFTSLFMNLLQFAPALFMMQVYDRVLTSRSVTTLVLMAGATLGLLVMLGLLDDLRNRLLVRIGVRIDADLHARVFKAIFRRNLSMPGAASSRALGDIGVIRSFASGPALVAFFDLPWTPIFIVVCWIVHPWLALVALASAFVLLSLTLLSELTTRGALERAGASSAAAEGFAAASLRNSEVVEAMGMLPNLMRRWKGNYHRSIVLQAKASDRAAILNSISRWTQQTSQMATLAIGAYLVIDHEITPGLMMICTMMVARGLLPINQLVASWKSFVGARGAGKRIAALLREFEADPGERMPLPAPAGALRLERVVVGSNDGRPILKGIGFDVPAGTSVGVIGPSGSGKTTLARAILGVVPLAQGVVRLDGADVALIDRVEAGPSIGYLPQDIELFNGTAAENIGRFGALESERIIAAAKLAGVHDLILSMPDGYETRIGEQGAILSAGQRQRLALARAVYGEPCLVVLDEPNSNLDMEGEQALQRTLAALKARGTTVLVIAHRTSILSCLDRVLVLKAGMVEAYGQASEVLPKPLRPVQGAMAS
jgi:PrtD family type I secretion system ABC transporter